MKADNFTPPASVMDLLPDAICVVNKQGCFVAVSGACERIFGCTPEGQGGRGATMAACLNPIPGTVCLSAGSAGYRF